MNMDQISPPITIGLYLGRFFVPWRGCPLNGEYNLSFIQRLSIVNAAYGKGVACDSFFDS